MRAIIASLSLWAALAGAAFAIPFVPPPRPVYEAPIDRALDNVAAMEDVEPAQRERLLGRLNLLAYARDDAPFAYLAEDDRLHEAGAVNCAEAAANRPRRYGDEAEAPDYDPNGLCARFDFQLGPRAELPEKPPAASSPAARARLEAAAAHYRAALDLDRADLRARLGYAYALDRLGRQGEARKQLRLLIEAGLPRLSAPQSNWEDHAVLTEAAEHLGQLARGGADRRQVARLRERLGASRPMVYVTPVLVPLADAPFAALIDPASPVAFDFAGTGDQRAQGWPGPDAAWLVWDPHGRGEIRSGFDLIGARTWAVFWSDGFEALRALDDDRNGELAGAELGGLALWRDANGDGISDPGEVTPVSAHGISALATRGAPDQPGLLTAPGGVRFEDGRARPLYDWTPGLWGKGPAS